ncbi:MAG: hypothetical protein CHACPFDD_01152 [Phycisphaerae bacterium]|nr:hypothetical protein [Phycisphaerae bacterium]
MSRLRRPHVWLPLALLLLAAAGALLLAQPECTPLSPRDEQYFRTRHYWSCAFASLSATVGSGLLIGAGASASTPVGRATLLSIGVTGAALFMLAAAQAARRLLPAEQRSALPHPFAILVLFLAFQAALTTLCWAAGGIREGRAWLDFAPAIVIHLSSLGQIWPDEPPLGGLPLDWLACLGWPAWGLLLVTRWWRRAALSRWLAAMMLTCTLWLLLAAALITALETPRGQEQFTRDDASLRAQPLRGRFEGALQLVFGAAGSGVQSGSLSERSVSDGTKFVVSTVVLVGGLGGSAGGGVKWPLLAAALLPLGAALRRNRRTLAGETAQRVVLAGGGALVGLVGLAALTTVGLLLIENFTAPTFRTPPSVADAFVDAASAVGGAALSTGVTAAVTDPNLSSGLGQSVDLYQYGAFWLMLAMFAGRILPVFVVSRIADARLGAEPGRIPPLI